MQALEEWELPTDTNKGAKGGRGGEGGEGVYGPFEPLVQEDPMELMKELTEKMLNTELTLSTESTVLVPARLRMQLSARTDATPLQVNAQNAVAPTHEKER